MKRISKFTFLILFSILYSCADKISNEEFKELIKVTESEKIDYKFNSEGIEVIIYNSQILEKDEMAVFISSVFYKTIVMRNNGVLSMNNFVKLIFMDENNNSKIFKTKYKDLIVLNNLERYLYEIINTNSLDKKYYVEKEILLKKIDSIFRKNKDIRVSKYEIKNFYSIFLENKVKNKIIEYQFDFRKNTPYKLFQLSKVDNGTD